MLYALGVGEALKALSCEAEGKEIRIWNSGETWKLFDLGKVSIERYGYPISPCTAPTSWACCERAVRREKRAAIHLGAKCVGFQQTRHSVALQLEAVGTVDGDVLIGADGVHSRCARDSSDRTQPQFTGIVAWRGIVPMERLPAAHGRAWSAPTGSGRADTWCTIRCARAG